MERLLVKVSVDGLAEFLRKHGEYWQASGYDPSFDGYDPGVATVSELVDALAAYGISTGDWDERFYVFNMLSQEGLDPSQIAERVSVDNAPEVKADELEGFSLQSLGGEDFLYVACYPIEASNGRYITILPAENPWREESPDK